MTTESYTVASVDMMADESAPCSCQGCDWTGPASETTDIESCSLTPGDASPVGRCPKCETLCYLDAPDAKDVAAVLREVMKHPHVRAYLPYDPTDATFMAAAAMLAKMPA